GGVGLTADGGLSWVLPRLVGLRKSQEIILTNRRINSDEAEAIGLVTRTVDDEALEAEGATLAERLANGPVGAIGATRVLLRESFETTLNSQLDHELRSMASAAGSAEAREGIAAFLAKRPANFRGN
ncbi:MAG: enoyl-CoA hydratase-related protein, partial [Sphingomonas sp.]|nr:enoyl-CoA hydratase-related protein [Sphingomonas sp.]